ncbi:myelin protein zero like 1 [Rhinolophus ferrumequinum]|uniref:Myelin protein zero like 1 n=1 Tax=Rhinolophus ferrumequinum TaxID=59479 RepID=A0A7J7SY53_RHIFE|nr:myelin protein zero like 1 [Rhinolophus ferrumequinum]
MAAPAGAGAVIAAPDRRRWLWPVLTAALGLLTTGVSALEVYTPKEIFVANGTQGKLTCKFKSTNTTGTLTTVSWSFQPEGADTTVSRFCPCFQSGWWWVQ